MQIYEDWRVGKFKINKSILGLDCWVVSGRFWVWQGLVRLCLNLAACLRCGGFWDRELNVSIWVDAVSTQKPRWNSRRDHAELFASIKSSVVICLGADCKFGSLIGCQQRFCYRFSNFDCQNYSGGWSSQSCLIIFLSLMLERKSY